MTLTQSKEIEDKYKASVLTLIKIVKATGAYFVMAGPGSKYTLFVYEYSMCIHVYVCMCVRLYHVFEVCHTPIYACIL